MSKSKIALTVLGLLFALSGTCAAQQEHVFKIEARGVGTTSAGRTLTGFRLRDRKGIITALHGVADVRQISAANQSHVFNDLKVVQVDVEHDLALLSSPELETAPAVGLESGPVPAFGAEVNAIGYPYGIERKNTTLQIRNPATEALEGIIPPGPALLAFRARNSPSPTLQVVSLQGPLVPGLSGAPLLDAGNRVFAVGDGGLEKGTTDFVWAIPLADASFGNAATNTRYRTLAGSNADMLFNDKADLPPVFPITDQREDNEGEVGAKHYAKTTLTITPDGHYKTVTQMKNNDFIDGFCLKPAVVFLDANGSPIHSIGEGTQWCTGSGIEHRLNPNSPIERTDPMEGSVPVDVLGRVNKIAIVHSPGSKDPFQLLQQNDSVFLNLLKAIGETVARVPVQP
jgi:hypothetical protein